MPLYVDIKPQNNLLDAEFNHEKRWEYVSSLINEAMQSDKASDWDKVKDEISIILKDKDYVCKSFK